VNYDNKLIRSSFEAVNSLSFNSKNEAVFCVWKLPLFPQLDVAFSVELINCTTDFLLLKDMQVCPHSTISSQSKQNQSRRDIIIKSEDISSQYESVPRNSHSSNVVTIYYGSTNPANNSFLLLKYTQLKLLLPISSGDHLVSMGRNCEFLCTNPPACLKQELVGLNKKSFNYFSSCLLLIFCILNLFLKEKSKLFNNPINDIKLKYKSKTCAKTRK
jgi:hypothetical protein